MKKETKEFIEHAIYETIKIFTTFLAFGGFWFAVIVSTLTGIALVISIIYNIATYG